MRKRLPPTSSGDSLEASRPVALLFLVVLFVLPIPLIMREFYHREPYPAVLLPAGAITVIDDGFVQYRSYSALAVTTDGRQIPVDWRQLLPGYPGYRRAYFAETGFGIGSVATPLARFEAERKIGLLLTGLTGETQIRELRFRKVLAQKATGRSRGKKPKKEKILQEWIYPLPLQPGGAP